MTAAVGGAIGAGRDFFFVWMAAACIVVAFGGFAGTYWLQAPAGTFRGPALLHMHGLIFSAWTLLFLSQTVLGARRRLEQHRAWGVAGVALATAMVFSGVAAAIGSMRFGIASGWGDQSRAFSIVPISAITLFAVFFVASVANVRRPDWHKRFMLVASVSLLGAPVARVIMMMQGLGGPGFRPGLGPPPPVEIGARAELIPLILLVAAIVYDWRTRGRPHPAILIGAGALLLTGALRVPISETPQWVAFADFLATFAGPVGKGPVG